MTVGQLEMVLAAGWAECQTRPFNKQLGYIGEVLEAMAKACGTGQMEEMKEAFVRAEVDRRMARMREESAR
jgi:hypothetical protein